ncbi:MAG: hypothetical protein PHC62_02295 [Candidatus Izemoplasmatales bacterium]|jgi:uncharacterized membrane protein YraQ (UPF0718 family)|nr:hypothetical protein [Candidatus Izemoplasmatales bacterium]
MIQTFILYGLTGLVVFFGFIKDKEKTKKAFKKAWKAFENILPQFLTIIIVVGLVLSFLDTDTISQYIGTSSGWLGVLIASSIGAITLIPGFIAFPMSAILLQNGAGYMQISAFISSLMMVGVVTFPVEKKFFGIKATIIRNVLAFLFAFVVAFVMGKVFGEL